MKKVTGKNLSLILQCECGYDHYYDSVHDSVDPSDVVVAVCDSCGEEYCSECAPANVKTCELCKQIFCDCCTNKFEKRTNCIDCDPDVDREHNE